MPPPQLSQRCCARSVATCSPHWRQNIHPLRTVALQAGHSTSFGCAPSVARSTPHSLQKTHSRSTSEPHDGQRWFSDVSLETSPPPHHLQKRNDFGYSMSQSRQYIYLSRSTMNLGIDSSASRNSESG